MAKKETTNEELDEEEDDEEDKEEENFDEQSKELIKKAEDAATALERENERMEKNLDRQEKNIDRQDKLNVEKALSGKAETGIEKKEETPKEYAERVMTGEVDEAETK